MVDTLYALKTVAEVSAAAALHVGTAANKHPEIAVVAELGEGDAAANEAAVISSLPAAAAEALCVAVGAAEGRGPGPVKFRGYYQVSVFLLVCDYSILQEPGL